MAMTHMMQDRAQIAIVAGVEVGPSRPLLPLPLPQIRSCRPPARRTVAVAAAAVGSNLWRLHH